MRIERKAGVGDLQHVRHQLLSIGIISGSNLEEQLSGAFMAGDTINMMARAHVICTQEEEEKLNAILHRNQQHQLLAYYGRSLPSTVYDTLDIIIHLQPQEIVSAEQVYQSIIEEWKKYGGRFAGGNFARLTLAELTEKYIKNANII